MVDEYEDKIALKDGFLRRFFRSVGLDIINSQRGARNIRFSVGEIYSRLVSKLPYAEHHLEIGPTGLQFYIKPTAGGTAPIKSAIFMPILQVETQDAFLKQLQIEGLKIKRNR